MSPLTGMSCSPTDAATERGHSWGRHRHDDEDVDPEVRLSVTAPDDTASETPADDGEFVVRRTGGDADRDVTVLLAEAQSKGEQTRGEGDAERNRIFAESFGRDPEFFSFYRSMQAYEAGLRPNDTRMLLKPDSDFFRYFVDPSGKAREGAPSGNATPPAGSAQHDMLQGLVGCTILRFMCELRQGFGKRISALQFVACRMSQDDANCDL